MKFEFIPIPKDDLIENLENYISTFETDKSPEKGLKVLCEKGKFVLILSSENLEKNYIPKYDAIETVHFKKE